MAQPVHQPQGRNELHVLRKKEAEGAAELAKARVRHVQPGWMGSHSQEEFAAFEKLMFINLFGCYEGKSLQGDKRGSRRVRRLPQCPGGDDGGVD